MAKSDVVLVSLSVGARELLDHTGLEFKAWNQLDLVQDVVIVRLRVVLLNLPPVDDVLEEIHLK